MTNEGNIRRSLPEWRTVGTFIIAGCCLCCFCSSDSRTRAPDFILHDLDGTRFYLNGQRGRIVLLNFWSVYCVPCRVEMPLLQNLAVSFDTVDVVVVGICVDNNQHDYVREMVDSLGLDYPILLDPYEKAAAAYDITAFPTTVIVDSRGNIQHRSVGYDSTTISTYTSVIHTLLARHADAKH